MARVVFLHKLPVAFAVRGRGFNGNGQGERRLIPYQLCSDRAGERPMKVGLFEMPAAAERYASSKGWTMQEIPFDNAIDIRVVGDGIKRTKSAMCVLRAFIRRCFTHSSASKLVDVSEEIWRALWRLLVCNDRPQREWWQWD
jgi:hypothetical protein